MSRTCPRRCLMTSSTSRPRRGQRRAGPPHHLRPESAMNSPGSIVISSRAPWADLRQRKQTVYDSIDAQHRRIGSL